SLGRGTEHARQANNYLLSMSSGSGAQSGAGSDAGAGPLGAGPLGAGRLGGRPRLGNAARSMAAARLKLATANGAAADSQPAGGSLGSDPTGGAGSGVSTMPGASTHGAQGVPTVLAFYASWCEQCNSLDKMFKQGRQMYGNRVRLVKVDVDDASNTDLV